MAGKPSAAEESFSMSRKAPSLPAWMRIAILPIGLFGLEFLAEKRATMPNWGVPEWKVFLTGSLWSLLFWICLAWTSAWIAGGVLRRRSARAETEGGRLPLDFGWVVWLIAAAASLWILSAYFITYKYLYDMYHLPNVHILQFTIYEWRNAWALAKDTLHWWHLLACPIAVWAIAAWLRSAFFAAAPTLSSMRAWARYSFSAAFGIGFIACSLIALGWHRFQEPLPWDANWSRMFWQYGLMVGGNTTNLQTGHRVRLPRQAVPPRHNVLVILNESLRADVVFPQEKLLYGFPDTLSPKVFKRVSTDSQYYFFPFAHANSGATNVSVPSLSTGLPPEATSYDFHRYATLWNYAKSLGYRTFVFTPQDWRWEHFDEFFLDHDVDLAVHRRNFQKPLVNDLGVDDGLVVDSLLAYLAKAPKGERFFGVIQFNITHPPFYGRHCDSMPFYSHDRYKPSVRLLDEYTDHLIDGLEKLGLYDSTLVVYTADHGENIRSRKIGRMGCFYEDALRIPFWIKPPKDPEWLKANAAKLSNLRAWTAAPIQNLDIFPTLLDFWAQPVQSPFGPYAGHSLFGTGSDSLRVMSGQNTCEIRAWQPEGCYVMRAPMKLVLANHTPPQLFDLSRDPLEQNNLWDSLSVRKAQEPWLKSYMRAMPGRLDLCRRLKQNCPDEFLIPNS
jgi:arylsulfatase A-like enzyme